MESASALEIRTERKGEASVVRLIGELDLAVSDRVPQDLNDELLRTFVVLDLSALEFCDSSGLRVLLDARRRAELLGGDLRLADLSMAVARVLELAEATGRFRIYPDVEAALAG